MIPRVGRWFKVVKLEKMGGSKNPAKSMLLEKELVRVANSMPKAHFLRITRKVSRDIEGSANDMDLCATTQVVPTPVHSALQE